MATARGGWHTSAKHIETPAISLKSSLCLADDLNVSRMYRRGGMAATHYTYHASWESANLASEAELVAVVESLGFSMDRFDGQPYLAMKNAKVRASVLDAGYDGASYEDTHEGCNYETTELLREPAGFSFQIHSTTAE